MNDLKNVFVIGTLLDESESDKISRANLANGSKIDMTAAVNEGLDRDAERPNPNDMSHLVQELLK